MCGGPESGSSNAIEVREVRAYVPYPLQRIRIAVRGFDDEDLRAVDGCRAVVVVGGVPGSPAGPGPAGMTTTPPGPRPRHGHAKRGPAEPSGSTGPP